MNAQSQKQKQKQNSIVLSNHPFQFITNDDIRTHPHQYSMADIYRNIEHLSISYIIRYQTVDGDFCRKYALNDEYLSVEESYLLTFDYILSKQPHLTYDDLV